MAFFDPSPLQILVFAVSIQSISKLASFICSNLIDLIFKCPCYFSIDLSLTIHEFHIDMFLAYISLLFWSIFIDDTSPKTVIIQFTTIYQILFK